VLNTGSVDAEGVRFLLFQGLLAYLVQLRPYHRNQMAFDRVMVAAG
jgi:hypothetical protein